MAPERTETVPSSISRPMSMLLVRIESEYNEMPGLKLTEAQARRLWNLDSNTCSLVLATLLRQHFLKRTARGTYIRSST
jgi:hypothetical protein